MRLNDLYWLAGLLEGEGCFCYYASPGIQLVMTDRDVVERAAALLDRHVRGPYQQPGNRKATYHTDLWGENAIGWMKKLKPLMGARRTSKIEEILSRWGNAPGRAHKSGTGLTPQCEHPEREHYAFGLCRSCYRKDKYKQGLPR